MTFVVAVGPAQLTSGFTRHTLLGIYLLLVLDLHWCMVEKCRHEKIMTVCLKMHYSNHDSTFHVTKTPALTTWP